MKQYFAYTVFTACLINAMVRPEMASLILAGIAALFIFLVLTQTENDFEKNQDQKLSDLRNKFDHLKSCVMLEVQKDKDDFRKFNERLMSLEELNINAQKELADTKRTVRDLNLANTFVPRNKRNVEL